MQLRTLALSKTNMLLRSELKCVEKRLPLTPLENGISQEEINIEFSPVAEAKIMKLTNENSVLQDQLQKAIFKIHRLNDERKILLDMNLDLSGRIRVFCRLRPALEIDAGMELIEFNVLENEKLEIRKIFNFCLIKF